MYNVFYVPLLVIIFTCGILSQKLNYKYFWVANYYKGDVPNTPNNNFTTGVHVGHNTDGLYVLPSGMVFTNNADDEGGMRGGIWDKDGNFLANACRGGMQGGIAVTANSQYVFRSIAGRIGVYNHQGVFQRDLSAPNFVSGLAWGNNRLYACDYFGNKILIWDSNLNNTASFTVDKPMRVEVDRKGFVWVLCNGDQMHGTALKKFTASGSTDGGFDLPAGVKGTALCVDKDNRLYVCDNGPEQNIKIFDLNDNNKLVGTFGEKGGGVRIQRENRSASILRSIWGRRRRPTQYLCRLQWRGPKSLRIIQQIQLRFLRNSYSEILTFW